ncbi:BT_2262 family domain-containing protein [Dysgonomonas termitidis]|uniref:BT_2262 family domain-containing protein n=1 Tax=Dysgonomonas termitidis TaxID=1516126 RepID=A0ABV9KWG0_9BACT
MKLLYKYSLIIASAFLLFSCDKETEDISKITYYCELDLKGDAVEFVSLGGAYTESGWVATENGEDITDKVAVSGAVNPQTPGVYNLVYSVNNSDGYPTSAVRKVIVYDTTPSVIATGLYHVDASSSRSALGGAAGSPATEFKTEPPITIYQTAPGKFYISDLFGGYYSIGRGYGAAYDISGIVAFDGTDFSLVSSNVTPWKDKHTAVRGTYNEETKTLVLQVDYSSFTFHLNIVENQ